MDEIQVLAVIMLNDDFGFFFYVEVDTLGGFEGLVLLVIHWCLSLSVQLVGQFGAELVKLLFKVFKTIFIKINLFFVQFGFAVQEV